MLQLKRTVPYKYVGINAFNGNLFNDNIGSNIYINNRENFNTVLKIMSMEITNGKLIIRVQVNDTYNLAGVTNGTNIYLNNNIYSNTTDSNGIGVFVMDVLIKNQLNITSFINSTNYIAGNNTFYNYNYSDDNHRNNKTVININVSNNSLKIGEELIITAILTDEYGNPINNAEVNFYLNGILIGKNTTYENGIAYLKYKSNFTGEFTLNNTFNGNMQYSYSTNSTYLSVLKNETQLNITVNGNQIGETITLKAKLTYNPTIPGQRIIFKLNGNIIGEAITDSNGIASMNYKFTNSGNHIFSAEYLGNSYYNPSSTDLNLINIYETPNVPIIPEPIEYHINNGTTNNTQNNNLGNTSTIQRNSNSVNTANAKMKSTGIGFIPIVLVLLSLLGITSFRDKPKH
ncbi:hypothetical protein ALNOE001_19710 [Candidatus Methanobinarius endosymbioticus]|uniref:Big-1 domain-containing protein n=1 Tax=Candidatus Methanobinarius endosymbioticus TaxID=2006182 RepID=A0A366M885_9EURY|nr:hypothetical protein ALNOE001_19710 [Candidatus Methanobinarius endosymbioticus]